VFDFLKSILSILRNTPLHPQWFAFFREARNLRRTCANLSGVVLDVGCAEAHPRHLLPEGARYIGVDYFVTAKDWYGTRPDVFADARALPFSRDSVDHALLLDVLEHIPDPDLCIAELSRVLKVGGSLTIQVPFLYPVHDAPLDFHRWTRHGLERAAERNGFEVEEAIAIGHPLETAALNANIALSKTVINWIRQLNPLALSVFVLPFAVVVINCSAWFFALLGRSDNLMPYSYRMVWTKI
jgi:SAM-dependent methyltransferase